MTRFSLLVALVLLAGRLAVAAPGGEENARAHHEQGRAAAASGAHETAIAEFRRAYELKADPSFLLDLAEAYRGLGGNERAVFFYRRYLATHPNPPNRPEVERQIALLAPPAPTPTLPPAAPPEAAATAVPPSLATAAVARSVSEKERSVIGRWWFWTAVGALAAAGATVAILATTRDQNGGAMVPETRLGNARIDF